MLSNMIATSLSVQHWPGHHSQSRNSKYLPPQHENANIYDPSTCIKDKEAEALGRAHNLSQFP